MTAAANAGAAWEEQMDEVEIKKLRELALVDLEKIAGKYLIARMERRLRDLRQDVFSATELHREEEFRTYSFRQVADAMLASSILIENEEELKYRRNSRGGKPMATRTKSDKLWIDRYRRRLRSWGERLAYDRATGYWYVTQPTTYGPEMKLSGPLDVEEIERLELEARLTGIRIQHAGMEGEDGTVRGVCSENGRAYLVVELDTNEETLVPAEDYEVGPDGELATNAYTG